MDFISDNAGLIGLLFFIAVFAAIAFWALRPSSKERIESYKNIPLKEEPNDLK
jgi:cbb3-type cytochrome oxidase subunit 3